MTLRIGVTGGRDFANWHLVTHVLRQMPADATLVHGGARGADSLCAEWWGDVQGRCVEPHAADWAKHGKGAGVVRNQEMVDSGLDLLVAFPGGKGTADMVARCQKAGVRVLDALEGEITE